MATYLPDSPIPGWTGPLDGTDFIGIPQNIPPSRENYLLLQRIAQLENLLIGMAHSMRSPAARLRSQVALLQDETAGPEPSLQKLEEHAIQLTELADFAFSFAADYDDIPGRVESLLLDELMANLSDSTQTMIGVTGSQIAWDFFEAPFVIAPKGLVKKAIETTLASLFESADFPGGLNIWLRSYLAPSGFVLSMEFSHLNGHPLPARGLLDHQMLVQINRQIKTNEAVLRIRTAPRAKSPVLLMEFPYQGLEQTIY
ncbi:MAG: hypothetical protein H6581_03435 [Bacteroidia bacterium]|nr:hypothetical protein [Bacteroidia bacterium]